MQQEWDINGTGKLSWFLGILTNLLSGSIQVYVLEALIRCIIFPKIQKYQQMEKATLI